MHCCDPAWTAGKSTCPRTFVDYTAFFFFNYVSFLLCFHLSVCPWPWQPLDCMDCWSDDSQGVVDHENKNMDASVMMFSYYLLLYSLELDKRSENVELNRIFSDSLHMPAVVSFTRIISPCAFYLCPSISPLCFNYQTTTLHLVWTQHSTFSRAIPDIHF